VNTLGTNFSNSKGDRQEVDGDRMTKLKFGGGRGRGPEKGA